MYRKNHDDCPVDFHTCTSHAVYKRQGKKWVKVGTYHDVCETLTPRKDELELEKHLNGPAHPKIED